MMSQEIESNNSLGSANTLQSGVSTTGQFAALTLRTTVTEVVENVQMESKSNG